MPRLIVTRGVDEGKQFELAAASVTVGRHSSNAVALHDTQVSRRHLELRAESGGGFWLVDLGSGNGTLLNGHAIQEAPLRSGDTITVGQSILMYIAGRTDAGPGDELTERVKLLGGPEADILSAVVRTVSPDIGSQILARPTTVSNDWLRTRLASLAALYETAEAVSHILDVDELLAKVMQLVLRSVDADHGCFMLRNEDGGLTPKAVRYRDGVSYADELAVSRTVVDHVLKEGQGVLVSDVQADARFRSVESLHKHNIREAICVPMKGRRDIVGVLFLDTQSTKQASAVEGRWNYRITTLASAIAHQAAIAVGKAAAPGNRSRPSGSRPSADHRRDVAHVRTSCRESVSADMVRPPQGRGQGPARQRLKLVEPQPGRIDQLIQDMLSYSKDREPAIEPTDLNKPVGRARTRSRTRRSLDWRPGGVDAVACDRGFTARTEYRQQRARRGRRPAERQGAVQALLEADGNWAKVIVVDNGPGIATETLEDIFKPFVSSKGSRGTGLGLPVSRKILREHGGDIHLQSVPEKGSKFVLRIPLKSAFAGEPSGTLQHPPLRRRRSRDGVRPHTYPARPLFRRLDGLSRGFRGTISTNAL